MARTKNKLSKPTLRHLWLDRHDDLEFMWSAARVEETEALHAWFAGTTTYEVFTAALDREEAAARALAEHVRSMPGRKAA